MKREFLTNLGIDDKDIIKQILDENSTDIGRAKGELDTYKTKVSDLEKDIKTKEATISTLQAEADKVEGLNTEISQLKADKEKLTTDLNTQVTEIKKAHAVEDAIRAAKGKNVKAIKALLDESKITYEDGVLGGVTDQLDALAQAEDSSMLFGDAVTTPAGTHLHNPDGSKGGNPATSTSFADAVQKALSKK